MELKDTYTYTKDSTPLDTAVGEEKDVNEFGLLFMVEYYNYPRNCGPDLNSEILFYPTQQAKRSTWFNMGSYGEMGM